MLTFSAACYIIKMQATPGAGSNQQKEGYMESKMKITWIQNGIEDLGGRVVTVSDGVERYWAEFPAGTEADAATAYCGAIDDPDFDPTLVHAEIFESVTDGLESLSIR